MSELASAVKSSSRAGTVLGILTILLGVMAMAAPLASGLAIATVVAVLLVVAGGCQLVFAFGAGSLGNGVVRFLFGAITLVGGASILARPLLGLASITLLLAGYFVIEGIFETIAALQVRPEAGWGSLLVGGLMSLILGVMIWRNWPLSGAWAIGILVGVRLLMAGWTMVALGAAGRGLARELADGA